MSERSNLARDITWQLKDQGFTADHLLLPVTGGSGYFRSILFDYTDALSGRIEVWTPTDARVFFIAAPEGFQNEQFSDPYEALSYVIDAQGYVSDSDLIQAVDEAGFSEDINIRNNPVPPVTPMRITYEIAAGTNSVVRIQPEEGATILLSGHVKLTAAQVRQVIEALTMALDNIGEAV